MKPSQSHSHSQLGAINPRVFLDVELDGNTTGRLILELFADVVPKTAENFRCLATGERGIGLESGVALHYRGSIFHRIIPGFMIQGGDFTERNGKGGESIYGGTFPDENFLRKHDQPYLLSMANRGPNTNGSQFFITTRPCPHLNGKHVVFGRVVHGQELVDAMEQVPVNQDDRPFRDVKIVHCGELELRLPPKPSGAVINASSAASESVSESGSESGSDSEASSSSRRRSGKHGRRKDHRKKDTKRDRKRDKRHSRSDRSRSRSRSHSRSRSREERRRRGRSRSPAVSRRYEEDGKVAREERVVAPSSTAFTTAEPRRREPSHSPPRRYKGRGTMRYRTPPHLRRKSPSPQREI